MKIEIKKLVLQNFKGCKDGAIEFEEKTDICGKNDSGKTTLLDSFTWLLFNKNAEGVEKFDIRPLDSKGNQINNVEIMVEGTFEIDGKEVVLKKVQKQKWVKKRGTDIVELQGNENLFEINNYPKSEKDYKTYISDLIEEDLFKIITNPKVFPLKPWKEQRQMLMKLSSDVSDVEIAESDSMFVSLIPELEQASTDDIRAKYTKALSEWKKKQVELPARIDEVSKAIVDIDVAELELHKNGLMEQISEVDNQLNDAGKAFADYTKKTDEIMRLQFEVNEVKRKENESLVNQKKTVQKQIDDCDVTVHEAEKQISLVEMDIDRAKRAIERNEAEKVRLQTEYKTKKEEKFPEFKELAPLDENCLVCPTCGQELPEDVRKQSIVDYEERSRRHEENYKKGEKSFEESKKQCLNEITEQGNAKVGAIKKDKTEIEQLDKVLAEHKANVEKVKEEKTDLQKIYDALPSEVDLSANQVFKELQLRLSKMEESLKSMNSSTEYHGQLKIKLSGLREELSMVEKEITRGDNSKTEERIAELQEEQKKVGQKVADQEKQLYLLEEFIRAKMNRISDSINGKFKLVNWKLFDMQINGGMKECCECTVNGVPYSSLNSAKTIQAGLDIINTLQEMYGVKAPIFNDNRESVTEIPNVECQVINLSVKAPIYEYEMFIDEDGVKQIAKDEDGNPIILKTIYDGHLYIEKGNKQIELPIYLFPQRMENKN